MYFDILLRSTHLHTLFTLGLCSFYLFARNDLMWIGISSKNSVSKEQGVSNVLNKYHWRYDVQVTLSTVGTLSDLPWIKPSDFMTSMARTGDFSRLLGGMSVEQATSTLKVFWQRYHDVFPNHELFNSHLVDHLHQCVPVYCHGDEGTGYKKKGVLIISFQAALGHGGRHAPNSKDPCCETVPFML